MLKITDLNAYYGEAQVLFQVNLEVNKGEIVCLIGNNGAGKTTTVMCISGILEKKSGHISLEGSPLIKLSPHQIVSKGISLVPEGRHIFPTLTVEENLKMGAFLKKKISQESIDHVYGIFPKLHERRRQLGGSLSGGEQQMLAIGRALMSEPQLLVLDEPSLGLAPQIIDTIFDAITSIKEEGVTVLLIEQNASLALEVSDRAYVMETGKIVLEGDAESLKTNSLVQRAYLGVNHAMGG